MHPQMLRHSTDPHAESRSYLRTIQAILGSHKSTTEIYTQASREQSRSCFCAVARVPIQNERRWHFSRVHKVSSLVRSCVPNAAIRSASAARISAGVSERHAPQSERCQQALSHRTLGCALWRLFPQITAQSQVPAFCSPIRVASAFRLCVDIVYDRTDRKLAARPRRRCAKAA